MELDKAIETIEQALNMANKVFTLQDSAVVFTALNVIKSNLLINKETKSDESDK